LQCDDRVLVSQESEPLNSSNTHIAANLRAAGNGKRGHRWNLVSGGRGGRGSGVPTLVGVGDVDVGLVGEDLGNVGRIPNLVGVRWRDIVCTRGRVIELCRGQVGRGRSNCDRVNDQVIGRDRKWRATSGGVRIDKILPEGGMRKCEGAQNGEELFHSELV